MKMNQTHQFIQVFVHYKQHKLLMHCTPYKL